MTRDTSKFFSLQGKFTFYSLALVGLTLACLATAFFMLPIWWALILSMAILVPLTILIASKLSSSLVRVINALADSTDNIKDHDFSVTIASTRDDELGRLVKRHNEVGQLLREERHNINQRELLLDTVLQSTPVAMLLCDDRDHVVYSNMEARQLLAQGKRLQGLELSSLLTPLAEELAQAIAAQREGLISIENNGELETYYLSCGFFSLNNRIHRLHLIRHMTREISRQEVATWKRVIRVISHELNNSLAPISSLSHSGKLVMSRLETATKLPLPESEDWQKLQLILSSIGERSSHLKDFIEGYARFARLPAPRIQLFDLVPMLNRIAAQQRYDVVTVATLMEVRLDETQCEQVLINLVKNARDAAGETGSVRVEASWRGKDLLLIVSDDGPGMSDQVLRQALLPFYSTKKEGTGLGLPLSREIVEAHGGQLSIRNRQISGIDVVMRIPQ
jgi:two-component system nitrogen regulation sensor histidine kinase NtrY